MTKKLILAFLFVVFLRNRKTMNYHNFLCQKNEWPKYTVYDIAIIHTPVNIVNTYLHFTIFI